MPTMKDLANLFGVQIGEEFTVQSKSGSIVNGYKFQDKVGLVRILPGTAYNQISNNDMPDLINGKIIKMPWKPRKGDEYWVFELNTGKTFCVKWADQTYDHAYYAIGNCFRTQEEAEAHKDEVIARLNEIYEKGRTEDN